MFETQIKEIQQPRIRFQAGIKTFWADDTKNYKKAAIWKRNQFAFSQFKWIQTNYSIVMKQNQSRTRSLFSAKPVGQAAIPPINLTAAMAGSGEPSDSNRKVHLSIKVVTWRRIDLQIQPRPLLLSCSTTPRNLPKQLNSKVSMEASSTQLHRLITKWLGPGIPCLLCFHFLILRFSNSRTSSRGNEPAKTMSWLESKHLCSFSIRIMKIGEFPQHPPVVGNKTGKRGPTEQFMIFKVSRWGK